MIGILIIATNKYKQYVGGLIQSLERYFLVTQRLKIILFTDELMNFPGGDSIIVQRKIFSYKFPFASLYRYRIFSEHRDILSSCSHLFYLDADMKIIDFVDNNILDAAIIAVRHPGFYAKGGWGSPNNPIRSTSWIPQKFRNIYYAGGFQGGKTSHYLSACTLLTKRIEDDRAKGVMAEWHDETHWNRYCNCDFPELVMPLDPSYCMPEEIEKREAWGIDNLKPKIIALSKDHKLIRQ